jgi:hypothetical protein
MHLSVNSGVTIMNDGFTRHISMKRQEIYRVVQKSEHT